MPECFLLTRRRYKLGRLPVQNLVRAERSRVCIYAFIERKEVDNSGNILTGRTFSACGLDSSCFLQLQVRGDRTKTHDHPPRWSSSCLLENHVVVGSIIPQTSSSERPRLGKNNNEKAILLFDSRAEFSIIDTTFARKAGCVIGESQKQECVGIGGNLYMAEGRTKMNITLNGSLVFYFDVWVGDQVGQEAILGMDFMVLDRIRLIWRTGQFVCWTKLEFDWKVADHRMGLRYNE